MSKWGQYAKATKRASADGGLYIRVGDGESVEFIVPDSGIPHRKWRRWAQVEKKYQDADGPGEGVQERILLPVFAVQAKTPKVLEMASSVFGDLAKLIDHPKVGGVEQVYEISRTGAGKDTRWSFQRIDRATAEQLALVRDARWPDLSEWAEPLAVPSGDRPARPADDSERQPGEELDDIPF